MVYVDPDPEIGSPPHAAGWVEQPEARLGPAGEPGDRSDAPSEVVSQSGTAQHDSATGSEDAEADDPSASEPGAKFPAAGDRANGPDDPDTQERVDVAAFEQGVGEPIGTSTPDEVPWNEPALPMAWPPGMTPPDRGEHTGSLPEDSDDGDLVPEPDPTWPKLFGQSLEHREGGPVELAAGGPATASVIQVRDDQGAEGPAGGYPVGDETSIDQWPAVVNLTSQEPSGGSGDGESLESDGGQASVSTAVQQTKTEEGEVDLREAPADPGSIDVSRETSAGGGEGMDSEPENEDLEDEAAVAVREAVSRAAAEAGVDVSRETEPLADDISVGELDYGPSVDREAAAKNARVTFRIDRDMLNGDRRVMAVANQKGGVGKSTTAVNIGAYLALAGARVLVVDLDPQGNASTGLGLDHREIEPSIYDVLTGEASPTSAIRPTGVANLHVLPSTIDLAGAEVELVSAMSRETRLRRALESIDHQYDSILIDCPPSLGLLTVNALAAADELLIPIQCEYYALEGLGQLLRNVELVRANLNPELRIGGIVLTMYDGRTRLALQVVDEVRRHFTDVVYQTVVPRSVRLSEAPGYGLPIALYDPLSRGGIAYRDLTFELAERSGLLAPTGEGAS
jgi:chromosome partitioning protein